MYFKNSYISILKSKQYTLWEWYIDFVFFHASTSMNFNASSYTKKISANFNQHSLYTSKCLYMLQIMNQVCSIFQLNIIAISMSTKHSSWSIIKARMSFYNLIFYQGQLGIVLWRYVSIWIFLLLFGTTISCLPSYCLTYHIEICDKRCIQRP